MIVFIVLISASQALSRQKEPPASFLDPIGFYQKYISPVDGQRCPMYPSCSQYIRQGVKKHGLLKGWVMGFDRIVRCGRDEVKLSSPIWIKGEKHIFDPVENNDFWWSDK
jgi:putative membrane protein insertion efficiency factor